METVAGTGATDSDSFSISGTCAFRGCASICGLTLTLPAPMKLPAPTISTVTLSSQSLWPTVGLVWPGESTTDAPSVVGVPNPHS